MPFYTRAGGHLILRVKVQPRARRQEVVGLRAEALKIALTAPPVGGKANAALISFLSEELGIAKSRIEILSGETSREKRVQIPAACEERVKEWG